MMLTKACIDPHSLVEVIPFPKVVIVILMEGPFNQLKLNCLKFMPLDQLMMTGYSIVLVYANVYLYKFLKTQEVRNIAGIWKTKKEIDQKKIRKRNFVPAGVGLVHSGLFVLAYICE